MFFFYLLHLLLLQAPLEACASGARELRFGAYLQKNPGYAPGKSKV